MFVYASLVLKKIQLMFFPANVSYTRSYKEFFERKKLFRKRRFLTTNVEF